LAYVDECRLRQLRRHDKVDAPLGIAGGSPRIHAAAELTCQSLVANLQRLADEVVAFLTLPSDEHDVLIRVDKPPEPGRECRSQRDGQRTWNVSGGVVINRADVDRDR